MEPAEPQAEAPDVQIEVVDEEVPKKRTPKPKAEPKPKAAPRAKAPKAKAPKAKAAAPKARPSSPVSAGVVAPDRFGGMSSMDMVAELLARRSHQEREHKRLLYRSFLS